MKNFQAVGREPCHTTAGTLSTTPNWLGRPNLEAPPPLHRFRSVILTTRSRTAGEFKRTSVEYVIPPIGGDVTPAAAAADAAYDVNLRC